MRRCNKCECEFPPDSQLLETQLKYYVRGDESRRAQNAIIEFAILLKTQSVYYAFKCGPMECCCECSKKETKKEKTVEVKCFDMHE